MNATYFDISGAMPEVVIDDYTIAYERVFYFDTAVHETNKKGCPGTNYNAVVKHAVANNFKSIRIVTDMYMKHVMGDLMSECINVDWVVVHRRYE